MAARRVWVITGGSRGLGFSLARGVVGLGDAVVLCARDEGALRQAATLLATAGRPGSRNDSGETSAAGWRGEVKTLAGDVSDPEFTSALIDAAVRRFGRIDVLINNASFLGTSPQPTLEAYPLPVLERVYAVNVLAPLRLIQLALPHMRRQGRGVIINVTSDAAVAGYPGWGGYGSSKAALELITKTLRQELEGTGIEAVAVDPGDMRTQMHQEAFPGEDISDRPLPDVALPALLRLGRHGHEPGEWRYLAQAWRGPDPGAEPGAERGEAL